MKRIALAFCFILALVGYASAQTPQLVRECVGTAANCLPVSAANPVPSSAQGATNVNPIDCSGTVVTGGTAVNAFTASTTKHGFVIANLDTTEVMWISFTGTAVAGAVGSYPLAPATATTFAGLSSFSAPLGFGMNTALSVVAATSAHKFSCTYW